MKFLTDKLKSAVRTLMKKYKNTIFQEQKKLKSICFNDIAPFPCLRNIKLTKLNNFSNFVGKYVRSSKSTKFLIKSKIFEIFDLSDNIKTHRRCNYFYSFISS